MVEGRILVVEDEHIVAMGIQMMLKNLGCTVTGVASSGKEAISKAESTLPDLVLMDIMLKGDLDGIEASKEIITRFDIPVVYLTGSDHRILEQIWNKESEYLVKPFDETDLEKVIDLVLRRRRLEKRENKRSSRDLKKHLESSESFRSLSPSDG